MQNFRDNINKKVTTSLLKLIFFTITVISNISRLEEMFLYKNYTCLYKYRERKTILILDWIFKELLLEQGGLILKPMLAIL